MKTQIANWGNYPKVNAEACNLSSVKLLRNILQQPGSFIPRGNGRCYGDASLADHVISCLTFDNMLCFDADNGIFECESGVTLDQILDVIVPKGWFLPVTPGTKFISVGGAVASDVHGKNHHVDGSFCDHVTDLDLMLASGEIVTCSKTLHPELFEATRGGMGLTGIILRVRFRLKKIATSFIRQKQIKAANLQEIIQLFDEYKGYTYSMAWIDCLKQGRQYGRSILMVGENALPGELPDKDKAHMLTPHPSTILSFPFDFPSFVLNQYSIKAFNFLYYAKNIKKEINNIVQYDSFFYPLDKVLHWNRGYGKKGVVQYQFVLPLSSSEKGLIDILTRINKRGFGSFLAVLKLFGKQDNLISFPMEGYTLALDFPIRNGLFRFLDELDEVVLDYGGRLYLTKDARMKQDIFWNSYPGAMEFHQVMKKYNTSYKFRSFQSDRLGITV